MNTCSNDEQALARAVALHRSGHFERAEKAYRALLNDARHGAVAHRI
ncbi:MAG: hypothetical protein GKR94_32370 [Gammaproteobacteria bacterium]|nr:hypothetical protein [Gammaproteobacteria bacterium]